MMCLLGKKVTFDPFKEMTGFAVKDNQGKMVTGKIVYVNISHKWFSVEYQSGGEILGTSFKFSQIGTDVMLCG